MFEVQGEEGWVLRLGHQIDRLGGWFISFPDFFKGQQIFSRELVKFRGEIASWSYYRDCQNGG